MFKRLKKTVRRHLDNAEELLDTVVGSTLTGTLEFIQNADSDSDSDSDSSTDREMRHTVPHYSQTQHGGASSSTGALSLNQEMRDMQIRETRNMFHQMNNMLHDAKPVADSSQRPKETSSAGADDPIRHQEFHAIPPSMQMVFQQIKDFNPEIASAIASDQTLFGPALARAEDTPSEKELKEINRHEHQMRTEQFMRRALNIASMTESDPSAIVEAVNMDARKMTRGVNEDIENRNTRKDVLENRCSIRSGFVQASAGFLGSPFADLCLGKDDVGVLDDLEQYSRSLPGPKWVVGSIEGDTAIVRDITNGGVIPSMTASYDGSNFAKANRSRYAEVGPSVNRSVCQGLSNVLDLSKGMKDLYELRSKVESRKSDKAILFNVAPESLINSQVPIFAVSYRHSVFNSKSDNNRQWNMSEDQMRQLYAILAVVTERGRARIWCDRVLPPSTSKSVRWEAVGLLPYTMFPVIALGCQSAFYAPGADDRLWLEVERHMALSAHGIISVRGKLQAGRFSGTWMFISSVQANLLLSPGAHRSVSTCLSAFAEAMVCGSYSTVTSSTYGLEKSMKSVALGILRGESVEKMMGYDSDGVEDVNLMDFSGLEIIALSKLAEHSQSKFINAELDLAFLDKTCIRPVSVDKAWWNGTLEFVGNHELAEALKVQNYRRTYQCALAKGRSEMIVFATMHATKELHGMLIVRVNGNDMRQGAVLSYISNIPSSLIREYVPNGKYLSGSFKMMSPILIRGMLHRKKDGESTEKFMKRFLEEEGFQHFMPSANDFIVETFSSDELFWY